MWSKQIFVALLCIFLAWQQVAAVVNNGQSSKLDESTKTTSDNSDSSKSNSNEVVDSEATGTEEQANRREASLAPGDTYGAPIAAQGDSYLPPSPSNQNLPVPIYGVPDGPTSNIVYPEPPPDLPPPPSLPASSYGPPLPGNYDIKTSNIFIPPSNTYGPPQLHFEGPTLSPPKPLNFGPGRIKPVYGPPRFQYGPPGKPFNKFSYKNLFKPGFGGSKYSKPISTYGPPTGYFKDNYIPIKFSSNFGGGKFVSHGGSSSHSSFSGVFSQSNSGGSGQYEVPLSSHSSSSGLSTQYGVPSLSFQTINLNSIGPNVKGISSDYGVPDLGLPNHDAYSISSQFAALDGGIIGLPKPHYGPPQPSSNPKPPHPGAPAPPTPPDIKYDGWQPILGLVSRIPAATYGVPAVEQGQGDLSYNKYLIPPPSESHHHHHQEAKGSVGNLALETSYGIPQPGASDSYRAPLNIVTGTGGVVSTSGEEAHGNHQHNHDESIHENHEHHGNQGNHDHHHQTAIGVSSSSGSGAEVQALKSVAYEIFPNGASQISGGESYNNGVVGNQISDSYGAPPLASFSSNGPYAASHSYGNVGSSFGAGFESATSHSTFNLHNSFNSHKHHGYKGQSSSNFGLIPPSGIYGIPPSGKYGTPLYSAPHPRHPILHRDPVPPSVFDSISKHNSHKHYDHSSQSTYVPPAVPDLIKPFKNYGPPPLPSSLYSLPSIHSATSFQNVKQGSSSSGFNFDFGSNSVTTGKNALLNTVDSSYNLPHVQDFSHSNSHNVVGLDLTHPALTIDLTQGNHAQKSFSLPHDCSLKTQPLPSLSYGVPSANSYTASLSSLTTNIGGAHSTSSISSSYGSPESLPLPQAQTNYDESIVSQPHETYGVPDLSGSHSQKVSSEVHTNLIQSESQGKSYGKSVAASFGPSSELIQSQSIDLNNIPLQGAMGSYTLQIQSVDGSQGQAPHGQVLNDGLLQSILAAIEQPSRGGSLVSQPIIQFQKSLEQQNFVTNDTISSVVEQLADAEIRHSTQLAKDAIEKSSELSSPDAEIQHSSPNQLVVKPSEDEIKDIGFQNDEKEEDNDSLPLLEDNGIALYFSNSQRTKNNTPDEANEGVSEITEKTVHNSHQQ